MNRTTSTIVTPPASYPVALSDAKLWAKVDLADDDTLITMLIKAATESAEIYLGRSLSSRTLKLTVDAGGNGCDRWLGDGVYDLPVTILSGDLPRVIELPYGPIQSVTSVTTYDTSNSSSVFSSANYMVDTASGRLALNQSASWPSALRERASAEIVYVAGYATASDVPSAIKSALMMHIQAMYDARVVCDMPSRCEELLRRYKIYG